MFNVTSYVISLLFKSNLLKIVVLVSYAGGKNKHWTFNGSIVAYFHLIAVGPLILSEPLYKSIFYANNHWILEIIIRR